MDKGKGESQFDPGLKPQASQDQVVAAYRNLLSMEETFRILKDDLATHGERDELEKLKGFREQVRRDTWRPVVRDGAGDEIGSRMDLRKLGIGVRRRFWLILTLALLFAVGGMIVSNSMSDTYVAEAVLMYNNNPGRGDQQGIIPSGFTAQSVREMVQLPANLEKVASMRGIDLSADTLARMVTTTMVRQSNLIRVIAISDNASLSKEIANNMARVTVASSQERYFDRAKEAFDYYSEEKREAQDRLEEINEQIADFKKQTGVVSLDLEGQTLVRTSVENERAYQAAVLEEQRLKTEFENLNAQVEVMPDQVVRYEYDRSPLRARIGAKEMALLEARTRYGPENPRVQVLEEELRQLRQATSDKQDSERDAVYETNYVKDQLQLELTRMQGKINAAAERKESLKELVAKDDARFEQVPEDQRRFARLLRDRRTSELEIQSLTSSVRNAESAMETENSDVSLYKLAEGGYRRVSTATRLLPVIMFIIGGAVGFLFILFMEVSDSKIRTARQAKIMYDIPYMMSLPDLKGLNAANAEEKTLDCIRELAEVLQQVDDTDVRTVTISSSVTGEGKSTVAYHLASYLQRLGHNTLYMDWDSADNSYVDETVGSAPRIERALRGEVSLDQCIAKGKVDIMKAGQDAGMKELVKSDAWAQKWQELKSKYDYIVVDAPALFEDSYGINLAGMTDAHLFMIGSPVANRAEIESSLSECNRRYMRPTGLIINRMKSIYIEDARFRNMG